VDRLLWHAYAHLYDGLLDVFSYRDMIDRVGELADCSGRTVLDAGAGTGNVSRRLLQAGALRVISVDFSSAMLDRARSKLAHDVISGRVEIVRDDAGAAMASLPAAAVDRITAVNVLYALRSRPEFFRQARRVLAPGGFIIAAHTTRPGSGPIVREQLRRGGLRGSLRPRLIGIAAVDLVIDLLAHGGRYDFAPVSVLQREAAAEGLSTTSLGRCYGEGDGVNELLKITAVPH
jgi:SAM-dependent methyltransferase